MKINKILDKINVCDKCLRASCFQGVVMCDEARNAGVVEKTKKELKKLNLENSKCWIINTSTS